MESGENPVRSELDELNRRDEERVEAAGAATEAQMREAKAPRPDTAEELAEYVRGLVDRPHTYGTCVYAMSLAATAAFNFVAGKLGVTGFQASLADMDVLRQTRGFKWGRLLDYENLLYPQYADREHYPGVSDLLEELKEELGRRAKELLEGPRGAHPSVRAWWEQLVERAK